MLFDGFDVHLVPVFLLVDVELLYKPRYIAFLNEDFLAIGAPLYDKIGTVPSENLTDCGAVHIFKYSTLDSQWHHRETILPDSLNSGDNFGHAISARWYDDLTFVNELTFVVGAPTPTRMVQRRVQLGLRVGLRFQLDPRPSSIFSRLQAGVSYLLS